ncbi:hypothetical protein [Bacillus sp. FDAARGOS_1420]|uniref:hypothetical protein n=1 Tax=Bacillus sp. FDAARGOS_1420 TaxID=2856338 RepID=UPI001C5AFC37|nr:hypothetical protein [Bacillus sp. FDAARGOS_1420]MBW3492065.1 hypothetical protein [Bacillus sp. FDAARGOS_1420]
MNRKKELQLPNPSSPVEERNYSALTKVEIQSLLDQSSIEYKSNATKSELITLLEGDANG